MRVFVCLLLLGCGDDAIQLSIDLRTDYVPGVEFTRVDAMFDGVSAEATAAEGEDEEFLAGRRIGDLMLPQGRNEGVVRLLAPSGEVLEVRTVVVELQSRAGTTVTVDRNCRGVSCPMAGAPTAVSCLGGRCVDPGCLTGTEPSCPMAQCSSDEDCPDGECSTGRCEAGTCLLEGGECGPGFFCAGTTCEVRPLIPTDAGVSDAGDPRCGTACQPGLRCALGVFNCEDGATVCEVTGPAPSTVECRPSSGECDIAENCDGADTACPADEFSTAVCRESTGGCDPEESCDGRTPTCPPDELSFGVCRASSGPCDVAESCDAGDVTCPMDTFAEFGTPCPDGACDGLGECSSACSPGAPCSTGNVCELGMVDCAGPSCIAESAAAADTECRVATGPCDVTEICGGGVTCPPDEFAPAGEECRAPVGECDVAESCTGTSDMCPADLSAPNGTACGAVGGGACAPQGACLDGACVEGSVPSCAVGLAFDGGDDVAVLPVPVAPAVTATFEIFVNVPLAAGGPVMSVLGSEGWVLEARRSADDRVDFTLRTVGAACVVVPFPSASLAENWFHLALVSEPDGVQLFVDGLPNGSIGLAAPPGAIRLGTDAVCLDGVSFRGLLANVRLWNRVLDPDEILQNAIGFDPPDSPGLLHWWRLDENTGQELNDVFGDTGTRGATEDAESDDPRWFPG